MIMVLMALRGLNANKLRSFLTMLGVIIGVAAVITAVAIGEGSKQAVAESMQRLGTNVLTAFPGQQRRGGASFGFGSINTMRLEDAAAIMRECPSALRVSASVGRSAQIKYQNRNTTTSVNGTGELYPDISNHEMELGKYFTQKDVKSLRRVAVLGSTTAKDLFDQQNPIGKTIKVKGTSFQVIGRLKQKGGMGFRNPDDALYVPVTTAMRRLFGMDNIQNITVQARSTEVMDKAQEEMEAVLRRRHKIAQGGSSDFIIFNQADMAQTQSDQQGTFSLLITCLAIVSLIVGGIGIMNIMLVSVTERTREIGVRKALGAKRKDILGQFLLEALFLSVAGGLLGVYVGMTGSRLIGENNNWTVVITAQTVAMAFSFSVLVGIFFGFYPALKASKMNPIEALRYE
ncbi:MAG: ABC transporter permease [Armatimonadetes bacterium]|nr:ABC transporter permease [Armatimonadota bacterium]